MKNNLKKNFMWNLIGSTFNSFTSLFFLIIVTRINGIKDAGVFTFAFSNACLLQVIGIYVTRAYQVTEKNKNISDSDYIYTKIITCLIMIIVGILFGLVKGYERFKLIVVLLLIIYKALDAFSESVYSVTQKNDELYKVGISLFIKGLLGTIIFLITDLLFKNIIMASISIVLTNIIVIIFNDLKVIKKYDFKLNKIDYRKCLSILKFGFWTFLFTFLTQYLINAPKYSIDTYLNNDMQTIYGIIAMPATIMILISNFIVHPFLLGINKDIKDNEYKKLNSTLIKMSITLLLIGGFTCILAYVLGIPVLNLLYGIKLNNYLFDLLIIIIGATIFSLTIIISNILIAMRKTMSQTVIFIITSIFTLIVSNILVYKLSLLGATYTYLLSMSLLLILYIVLYIYIISKEVKNNEK